MLRSHAAGSLRSSDAGQRVTLAGWVARRRDHGGVIFIDLRDSSGVAQVVFREADVLAQAHRLRAEFCVAVEGVVEIRPEGNANPEIATGDIEKALGEVSLESLWLPGNATHGFLDFMLMMGVAGAGEKADYTDTLDLFHTMEAYFTWYPKGGAK